MIEKEPVTVVCSEKGWIRTLKGHLEDTLACNYKDGDRGKFVCLAETTDRHHAAASSGKFFTLDAGKLPGGRGHGEPVRLMVDFEATDEHRRVIGPPARAVASCWWPPPMAIGIHRARGRVPRQYAQG